MRLRMLARGVIAAECAWQPYAARKTSVPEAAHKRNVGSRVRAVVRVRKMLSYSEGVLPEEPSLLPTSEFQPQHANQLFFQAFYFELPGMLFLCSVVQRILQEPQVLPQLHLSERQPTQRLQRIFLVFIEFTRLAVCHAKCSECKSLLTNQWCAGIEPDPRLTHNQGIFPKPRIRESVRNDK